MDTGPNFIAIEAPLQELLLEEIDVLEHTLHDPEAKARYTALRASVASGQVEEALLVPLERVLEITLQAGRARSIHGPQGEQALLRLFNTTGRGAAIRKATNGANEALAALDGHVIEEIRFTPRTPGVYRLAIDTDHCQVVLEIDSQGVWIENVVVGL